MIKIEDVEVMGIRKAIKGMRNAMNSWDKSDSKQCDLRCVTSSYCNYSCPFENKLAGYTHIGEKDMELARCLIKAGSADRKFMRMIHVQADVTAPLYWWKQADKYCVGVTTNSTSTMHTIHKRDLTTDDFSHEYLENGAMDILRETIDFINMCRNLYIDDKRKTTWYQMIQLLPSSFNQMRTIDLDYETLFSIYHQRKNHKLNEWRDFCSWIESLPYMKDFLGLEDKV